MILIRQFLFQISALDTSAPFQDRLSQVFNLSLLATCKALQNQYDDNKDENLVFLTLIWSSASKR